MTYPNTVHLKQLTLRGFKSFATATQLTFEPGINCVVGPNGSGKSNVVDALAWVMGEQGAKTLRGGSMADVIFAGTSSRPALGRAEVSLTIDNSDGALPISYSEVTISRTLFRSGGSEYALNGTPVRLLDIQELLSDTGMGREMHVIVGQGRLDDVLTASPEERRYFIEEAAGVLKHRRRKDKALRKLEAMQANLQRLTDLTAELRRQLGPLARQAKAARTAQVIQAEVRDARARLLADDLAQAQARLASLSADDEKLEERRRGLASQREACREEVTAAEAEAARAHPLLADLTETWQRLSTQAERFTSLASLAAERRRSLEREENPERRESPEQLRERARKAREEEVSLTEARDRAHLALEQAEETRRQREEAEREADREAAALARTLADNREDAARLAGRITTAQSQIGSLEEESERVEAAKAGALERAAAAQAQVADAEAQVVAHDGGDDELSRDHERRSEALQAAKSALESALSAENEARTRRDVATTRAATLTASLEPADASAEIAAEIPGITGLLREGLEVDAGWEAAAEAALGELSGALLAEGIEPAIDALRHARDSEAGRVILALADARAGLPAEQAAALEEAARGALDSASEAVLASDGVRGGWPGLTDLLAGTVFAADLAQARRILAAGAVRVITAAGDVITAQTARGGARNEASILARQAEARTAEHEAEQATTDLAAAAEAVTRAREVLDEAQGTYDAASAELHARDAQLAAATAQLGVLRQSLTAANEEITRNTQRLEKIAERLAAAREELASLTAEQEARQVDPAELEERLAAAQAEKATRHEATTAARAAETEARLAAKVAEERARVIEGKPEALERQARAEEARLVEIERRRARRAHHAKIAAEVGELAERTLVRVEEARETAVRLRRRAEEDRTVRDEALSRARARLEELAEQITELDEARNRREIARAEARIILDQLIEKAREELSMEADDLVEEFGPLAPVPTEDGEDAPYVRAEQEERLAKAERKLSRLGKINPLALEEHAALEERHNYLSDQLEDLRRTRADLLDIVRDIDERVESVLVGAYEDVQKAFEEVFATLFPGGAGRLVLTGEDALTAGIEIEARPPGKRVKRLSLLSGGERSLTALAFLIAIFRARPSPFYVLDEVEAALDDVNLGRLLTIFKELQASSQLIVITHQKRTMEIADALYGVAMAEDGVTTVISQRIGDIT